MVSETFYLHFRYDGFSGINRKIQLKRIDDTTKELGLTAKWGGELTKAGVVQAEAMGKRFRQLYPGWRSKYFPHFPNFGNLDPFVVLGDPTGCGFLRLHNTYRHDLKVYASEEGRVQMTAAAFTRVRLRAMNPHNLFSKLVISFQGLLAMDAELGAMLVHMVKAQDTDALLGEDKRMR